MNKDTVKAFIAISLILGIGITIGLTVYKIIQPRVFDATYIVESAEMSEALDCDKNPSLCDKVTRGEVDNFDIVDDSYDLLILYTFKSMHGISPDELSLYGYYGDYNVGDTVKLKMKKQ